MARVKPVKKAAGATAKVAESTVLKPEAWGSVMTNSLQSAATELKKHMNCINPRVVRLAEKEDLCWRPHRDADPYWLAKAKAMALSDDDLDKAMEEARRRGF